MFVFFTVLLIAIGLSMDTFSLSLSYGMFNLNRKVIINISIMVGLFHFFMPLLGNVFGDFLLSIIKINEKTIIGFVFLVISLELINSLYKNEEVKPITSFFDVLLFSFTVSLDSFSTGIGIDVFDMPNLFVVSIFMIVSFIFTYIGLLIGKKFYGIIGRKAEMIGIVLLLSFAFFYLIY